MTTDVKLLPLLEPLASKLKIMRFKGEVVTAEWWEGYLHRYARANVEHHTAAKDAVIVDLQSTIEALRAEVRDLLRWNGDAEAMNDGLGRMLRDERARAERQAEALQMALNIIEQEVPADEYPDAERTIRAAIHPTAAQENDDA